MSPTNAPSGSPHSLVAVCGLYCGACSVYLASQDDPVRLESLAAKLGQSPEETRCQGCRAEVRSKHCRACEWSACAARRGHTVCGECPDFPCEPFSRFQAACPHRADIPADMAQILEWGPETWVDQIPERYTCPACQTINAAYDLVCRQCGHEPGSPFAAAHQAALHAFVTRI